ncbi:head-tail adaptor protein [Mesorhizobium sp. M7A.F.Ca.CA.004.11.2.1]|nr:head-tail adaptor protein [Mesorhizobium sp. M7A.F.Ca.CA.004.08.2.1]RUX89425.1 head-tail adaptor protein [Mesorhizobium sp. M7A.F.Ca.CA.004.08.1.1]RUY07944.1 head-tail adaptor protein [Mesorhizobium sp. M7A.F.Ca.CA.004.04.1.1]RUY30104.1 head-tail adaptor protein [Mesorhizobium sp. M7A.F.Ca.CA.004.12.1.1]RUY57070.1 head-tail adaptor protein [Mesorhizobium sp. M7A.F.Ca.CA.001.12.1.1]RUY84707.1 head-tail adaptor protein [Mesorhizobium sp. M7A.F.Ca.CA.001.10.2.1]RUZ58304.1 head-tail adaptor pr
MGCRFLSLHDAELRRSMPAKLCGYASAVSSLIQRCQMKTTTGQLRENIAFDSRGPYSGPDDGNTEGPFEERFIVSARRQYLRGTETVMAARLEGRQPVLLTVRANSLSKQITTDWQARDVRSGAWVGTKWTGITYAIKAINPTEDRAWIDILVESGVAS